MASIASPFQSCPDGTGPRDATETNGLDAPGPAAGYMPAQTPVQCGWCLRLVNRATHRAYGRPLAKLPGATHWICRHCAHVAWDAHRAAHPERHIVTYRTFLRQMRRDRGLD